MQKSVTFGLILPNNEKYDFSLKKVLPVIRLAILHVENNSAFLPEWKFHIQKRQLNDCSSTFGPLSAIEMRHDVQVFFGPVCDYDLAPVVRYTGASWGIPILTSGGRNSVFDNKTEYSLLTRMNGFYRQLADVVLDILDKFGWSIIGLIFSDHLNQKNLGRSDCYFAVEPIVRMLVEKRTGSAKKSSKPPHYKSFDEGDPSADFRPLLQEMMGHARVIVLCAPTKSVRRLLLAAESLGMIDSGEYVFLNIELSARSEKANHNIWWDETDSAENNTKSKKAFESVLTIRPRTPDSQQYRQFSDQVRNLSVNEFGPDFGVEYVTPEAASFYEAVLLYVTALKDALRKGFSPKDGKEIYRLMQNRTISGIGGNFSIDVNNDRHVDFAILDMEPTTGILREVAAYLGTDRRYIEVPFTEIHWAGGRQTPPPDEPKCGFDGAKCVSVLTTSSIVAIVLSILLMIVTVVAYLSYRHHKKEAELAMMTWLIKYDDLKFGGKDELRRTDSRQSLLKMGDNVSVDTMAMGLTRKQIFAPTAYCKKQLCAVKKLNSQQIVLSRPLLKEFKVIQGLTHDHIARFVGACFDSEPPCLLFEYCPRGSLEDILENEELELDWMFRYSLMHDLVKGMAYLHSSELKTHGNLKSTNCVVDSRFVLKVTDYGPHCMRPAETEEEENPHRFWRRKLWTAPELLRNRSSPSGTQKGDVYSFAIIAQEIVYRNGPFYLSSEQDRNMDPMEIIRRVSIMESRIPFRPTLESSAADELLIVLIEKCWSEDPNIRPDFPTLRNYIRKLNRENESGNLLDNLLQRMEQYANNLESLVQERTADYLEQKRKAEELLYQLLPRAVAGQLIRGESVKAESFDSVTIYFSDIVGFTTLSASSTPFEVVNFLNDLYTCFDAITENFDVYKVETIGDAYVVVSGLPVRNGDLHAREVARMSLSIVEAVKTFRIRHRPEDSLRVRIGMHTGPCVAGVVGLKMPRYCLFGDTVNTASRMESNSLPLRIHVSEVCRDVLHKFGTFHLELRGQLEVKGKGIMVTYWLNGEYKDNNIVISMEENTGLSMSAPVIPHDLNAKLSTSSGFHSPAASASSGPLPFLDDGVSPGDSINSVGFSTGFLMANGLANGAGDFYPHRDD
ncbi:Atrial natriuretic peptide receptor 1 [Hypsibius exemplaris]|uniref:Guanylate cyclase n=1 Tax=Hypsibius exemplaris TaxID=2072580 RepID=A0A1W0XEX6_HYPEX|nr:Atrial natriuretic peptide receptor 1 [Hypsibius exemplaris]